MVVAVCVLMISFHTFGILKIHIYSFLIETIIRSGKFSRFSIILSCFYPISHSTADLIDSKLFPNEFMALVK